MKKRNGKPLLLVVAQAIAVGALIAASPVLLAQDLTTPTTPAEPQKLDKVNVTGSIIKRTQTEGALPVLTLDRAYIEQSGATSAVELIQSLPQVQNFVSESSSVNGGGAGVSTASLHALPSKYTLVLIDGQRAAPAALNNSFGGGFGTNLESIPLDAVDHVEILLDGASAIYGSDAIAGVINFIMKKASTAGNAYVQSTWPQHPGGGSVNAGLSKGFGDLNKDGWNVLFTYSYDQQNKLEASQRSFSQQGAYFPFSANGTNYIYNGATSNTYPANLTFQAVPTGAPPGTAATPYSLNPYYTQNGNCGANAVAITSFAVLQSLGVSCRFNYAATVQDLPSYERNSLFAKGYLKLGDSATLWATVALSSFNQTSQYAPPAQPLVTSPTRVPTLYNAYVQTFLTANNLVINPDNPQATLQFRAASQGGRTDNYDTNSQFWATGVDGDWKGWDYNARATLSVAKTTDNAAGGYTDFNCFSSAVAAGNFDPVLATGADSIKPCILGSTFQVFKSTLANLHLGAQHDFFELPGGPTILAVGADLFQQKYSQDPSPLLASSSGFSTQPASSDYPIGGAYGAIPYGMNRNNWAVYGEWFLPVTKSFEATADVRYDYYGKTYSNYVFSSTVDPTTGLQNQIDNASLGNTFSKATGKISARWLPVDSVLVRGSYGTGFRAPAMTDIAGALVFNGSTAGSYPCPFPGSTGCIPGSAQYDLLAGPNGLAGDAGLKPETSQQYTVGLRWDPIKGLSMGADLWDVKIKNQVLSQGIPEQLGFANPQQYAGLFTNPYQDPAGFTTIAFSQLPFNGGQANFQGVDWDFTYRTGTPWGVFAANWTGTQMLKAQYNFGPGQPFNSDLGQYGPDQQVVFRTTMQLIMSLQTGAWLNSLTGHYKSGYQDITYPAGTNIFLANPDGSLGATTAFAGLHVPSYTTWDWQTQWTITKNWLLTGGILNLFDRNPPLTLQDGGGGNQIGYDGRYTNPIGRAFYLRAAFKF